MERKIKSSIKHDRIRSFNRATQRDVRRRQIVDATIRSIDQVGFADTTLATVARIAGVAQGSLIFHFKSKDELLVATLTHLSEEYRTIWKAALDRASDDPIERLCVMVATEFQPNVCSRKKIGVWKAFWAEAKSRPLYQKICGHRDDERHAELRDCVARALPLDASARLVGDVAIAIDAQMDGLSEHLLEDHRTFSRSDAARAAFLTLKALFPAHEEKIENFFAASFPDG